MDPPKPERKKKADKAESVSDNPTPVRPQSSAASRSEDAVGRDLPQGGTGTHEPKEDEQISEDLEKRIEEMEKKLMEKDEEVVPLVKDTELPTQEEVDSHNATHAEYKSWCKHCNAGLATRDQHRNKANKTKKKGYKYGKFGEIIVPDVEAPVDGVIKLSMDYAELKSAEEESGVTTMVMVHHEDMKTAAYPHTPCPARESRATGTGSPRG